MLPTIQFGSTGMLTFAVQCFLNIKIDGQFGAQTKNAVIAFQKANNISADGIVGPNTWTAFAETRPTIRLGNRGNDVKALQYLLGITPDGQFGSQTETELKKIQMAKGMIVDGICDALAWVDTVIGVESIIPLQTSPVDYKQYDPRWGSIMFSNHNDRKQTIASSGCGPTAVADIIATWIDGSVTPVEMCNLAVANGFRTYNSGLAQAFMPFAAQKYGLKYSSTLSTPEVISAIQSGALVVALMGPGYWTNGGHYVLLWSVDPKTNLIYAHDPAGNTRTNASESGFNSQRKNYFIYSK